MSQPGDREEVMCDRCRQIEMCEYRVDPFQRDVWDVIEYRWLCDGCYEELVWEI